MKKIHLILLALFSGLLMAAAWPARGFTLLIFVAWVPLFFIQQYLGNNNKRGMFLYAWLTFFIWNVLTTFWIWNATQAGSIAAFLLNSLFMAIVFQAFHLSKKWFFNNKQGWWVLVFYWITFEAFHMSWQLSWPWLTLGNVFSSKGSWIQWYDVTGTLGGSFWVLAANIAFFHIINALLNKKVNGVKINSAVFLAIVLVPIVISKIQYNHYKETNNPVQVVAVQPNIDPYTEEFTLPPDTIIARNLNQAKKLVTDSTNYVLFPESTIQEPIWEDALWRSPSLKTLNSYLMQYPHLSVIVGASTFSWLKPGEKKSNAARLYKKGLYYYAYNTAFYLDRTDYIQVHHKSKLVPGVEEMPSWPILAPLEHFAIDMGGIVGTLKTDDHLSLFTNSTKDYQISPLICYESVYGDYVAQSVKEGAQILFIITNDGWWGHTPGYRQHFQMAILRAIETRRDVAQSSTTGISGFINQRGDILKQTKYKEALAIKDNLNLNDQLTFYVQHGDWLARGATFISALILLGSLVQGFMKRQQTNQKTEE